MLFASRSFTHFLMCAIHSDFSVAVAANTANDFLGLIICHPWRRAAGRNKRTRNGHGKSTKMHLSSGQICSTNVHRLLKIATGRLLAVKYVVYCTGRKQTLLRVLRCHSIGVTAPFSYSSGCCHTQGYR